MSFQTFSNSLCWNLDDFKIFRRISVEQNGMIATIVFSRQARLRFETCWLDNLQVSEADYLGPKWTVRVLNIKRETLNKNLIAVKL